MGNLNITQLVASQNQKEVTINGSNDELDLAMTDLLSVDFASGDVALTAAQYRRAVTLVAANLSSDSVLDLPLVRREAIVDNRLGTAALTVRRGTGIVVVPAGAVGRVYTDGTANGIALSGGSGSQALSSVPEEAFSFVPATRLRPAAASGSAALATAATGADLPDVNSLDFDQTTAEHAQFGHVFDEPGHMGNVSAQFLWSHAAASTFDVSWNAKAAALSDDDPVGSAFGAPRGVLDAGGTADDHYLSARTGFVRVSTPAALDLAVFDLFRDPAAEASGLDADARLQGVLLNYWRNQALDQHWPSVVLMAGFDGEDGATDQDDESDGAHVATYVGNAQVDTAISRFSKGSLLLDGVGDAATFPDSADWELGAGAFTLEGHFRWSADPAAFQMLAGQHLAAGNQRSFSLNYDSAVSNVLTLQLSSTGSDSIVKLSSAFVPTLGQWYHVAADFDGTTYWLYVEGVPRVSAGTPVTLFNSTAAFSVGAQPDGSTPFAGNADEVRLTKGVARYAGAPFRPVSAPFPRG